MAREVLVVVATKIPKKTALALKRKAKAQGKTPSELVRELVEEYVAPPSVEWAKALLRLAAAGKGSRRRKRPEDIDELTWAIDTNI